jgi:hypothetical protein
MCASEPVVWKTSFWSFEEELRFRNPPFCEIFFASATSATTVELDPKAFEG